jgi:hypothetical protein
MIKEKLEGTGPDEDPKESEASSEVCENEDQQKEDIKKNLTDLEESNAKLLANFNDKQPLFDLLPLCDTKNLITILSSRLTESESDPTLYNEDLTVNEDRVGEIEEEINQ